MSKNENRVQYYFRLPANVAKFFDTCIHRLGYKNRAEIFTAFAYAILELETEKKHEPVSTIAKNLRGNQTNKLHLSETQIKHKLRDIIGTLLKPVIAVRGVETAYIVGCDDVRCEFYEKYGLLLTDDEIHEGFYQYDLLNKSALREYHLARAHPKEETNND